MNSKVIGEVDLGGIAVKVCMNSETTDDYPISYYPVLVIEDTTVSSSISIQQCLVGSEITDLVEMLSKSAEIVKNDMQKRLDVEREISTRQHIERLKKELHDTEERFNQILGGK